MSQGHGSDWRSPSHAVIKAAAHAPLEFHTRLAREGISAIILKGTQSGQKRPTHLHLSFNDSLQMSAFLEATIASMSTCKWALLWWANEHFYVTHTIKRMKGQSWQPKCPANLTLYMSPKYSSTSGFKECNFDIRGSLKPQRISWTVRVMNRSRPWEFIHMDTKVRSKNG